MIAPIFVILAFFQLISAVELADLPKRGIITVCNSTYCDDIESINWCPNPSDLHVYVTSENGDRFRHSVANFNDQSDASDFTITIKSSTEHQKILGFGGALTDASSLMISCLSEEAKKNLLNSYFKCDTGIGYYLLRTNLGGCDYSAEKYTYDDTPEPDPELKSFALNKMDTDYKIPLLKEAQALSCRTIRLKGSTWYWPEWMVKEQAGTQADCGTSEKKISTRVSMNEEYEDIWAQYHIKALTEYKNRGINFDYLTPGNEVQAGVFSYHWDRNRYQNWVTNHLCPTLKENGFESINLLGMDDQTVFLPQWAKILDNNDTRSCFKGFATHWYADLFPPITTSIQKEFCRNYPEQLLLSTESSICEYEPNFNTTTDWQKAVRYARDIITKLSTCGQGYIDWNLALDFQGGPNWVENFCYSAVAVDCTADEFHKRVLFYVLGHFSKFLPEGSVRVETEVAANNQAQLEPLEVVAFKIESEGCSTPNVVTIALNRNEEDVNTDICLENEKCANIVVPKKSILSTVSLIPSDHD